MILHDGSWASRANNPSPFVDGSLKRVQHLWFWLLTKHGLKIGGVVMYVNEQRGFSLTKESKIKENGQGRESYTDRELLVGRCLIQNFKTRLTRRNFSVRGSILVVHGWREGSVAAVMACVMHGSLYHSNKGCERIFKTQHVKLLQSHYSVHLSLWPSLHYIIFKPPPSTPWMVKISSSFIIKYLISKSQRTGVRTALNPKDYRGEKGVIHSR